jgi:hypothetical protein
LVNTQCPDIERALECHHCVATAGLRRLGIYADASPEPFAIECIPLATNCNLLQRKRTCRFWTWGTRSALMNLPHGRQSQRSLPSAIASTSTYSLRLAV